MVSIFKQNISGMFKNKKILFQEENPFSVTRKIKLIVVASLVFCFCMVRIFSESAVSVVVDNRVILSFLVIVSGIAYVWAVLMGKTKVIITDSYLVFIDYSFLPIRQIWFNDICKYELVAKSKKSFFNVLDSVFTAPAFGEEKQEKELHVFNSLDSGIPFTKTRYIIRQNATEEMYDILRMHIPMTQQAEKVGTVPKPSGLFAKILLAVVVLVVVFVVLPIVVSIVIAVYMMIK